MSRSLAACSAGVASTLLLPVALGRGLVNAPWRESLPERLGRGGWREVGTHVSAPVWLHAASLGEVGGLAPLALALKSARPQLSLLATTTSLTGRREVLERKIVDAACLLPLDHPAIVGPLIARLRPRILVISETEIWPNLLFAARRNDLPVFLINGRISDYSFPRYRRLRAFVAPALQVFARVLAQTALDAQRFAALGVPAERIAVGGCTKYDQEVPAVSGAERRSFAAELGLDPDAPCFVAGSVRPGEDETVLEAYLRAKHERPDLQLIVAPRHPDRFEAVAELLAARKLAFSRRSLPAGGPAQVILLDTIGELRRCYALASVAFVGGSLVDIGGHNPLEPAAFAVPVLVGPHTSTVRDAIASLREAEALVEVRTAEDLAAALLHWLNDDTARRRDGSAGEAVFRQNLGATRRIAAEILERLD